MLSLLTGWEVFLAESAHNSRTVLERAVLTEQVISQPLVLRADNGSPLKGTTLLEKLHDLSVPRPSAGCESTMTTLLGRCSAPASTGPVTR